MVDISPMTWHKNLSQFSQISDHQTTFLLYFIWLPLNSCNTSRMTQNETQKYGKINGWKNKKQKKDERGNC